MNGVNFLFDRRNVNNPCMGCKDRQVGCHGSCPKYAEFDRANKKRRDSKRQQREAEWNHRDFAITSYEKYGR